MPTNFPTSADSFTNPTSADYVSDEVGGRTQSEFVGDLADGMEAVQGYLIDGTGAEAWRHVGDVGQPAFANSWSTSSSQPKLSFRKWMGGVALAGVTSGGAQGTAIFTLPAGYRPAVATTILGTAFSFTTFTVSFVGWSVSTAGVVTAGTIPTDAAATTVQSATIGASWFPLDDQPDLAP